MSHNITKLATRRGRNVTGLKDEAGLPVTGDHFYSLNIPGKSFEEGGTKANFKLNLTGIRLRSAEHP